jgi:protein gp37
MSTGTGIEWTDATWNPTVGCSVISPGCKHCYAMKMAARLAAMGQENYRGLTQPTKSGPVWTGIMRTASEKTLTAPFYWKKPRRVFVNSMSDLFHEELPFEAVNRIFAVMALCTRHTFQVLTKRPDRMLAYIEASPELSGITRDALVEGEAQNIYSKRTGEDPSMWLAVHWPLKNVWLGASVEDQRHADLRLPFMQQISRKGWRTFVSYEPALGQVDWTGWDFLNWLISGGESGPDARPSYPDWHRAARDFCARHAIPFFFKQWGAWAPSMAEVRNCSTDRIAVEGQNPLSRVGKKAAGAMLDGVEHRAWPR